MFITLSFSLSLSLSVCVCVCLIMTFIITTPTTPDAIHHSLIILSFISLALSLSLSLFSRARIHCPMLSSSFPYLGRDTRSNLRENLVEISPYRVLLHGHALLGCIGRCRRRCPTTTIRASSSSSSSGRCTASAHLQLRMRRCRSVFTHFRQLLTRSSCPSLPFPLSASGVSFTTRTSFSTPCFSPSHTTTFTTPPSLPPRSSTPLLVSVSFHRPPVRLSLTHTHTLTADVHAPSLQACFLVKEREREASSSLPLFSLSLSLAGF